MQVSSVSGWLTERKWKNRLLLVYAPTPTDPNLVRQRALLASSPSGIAERDLLIRELPVSKLSPEDQQFLQKQLKLSGTAFQVLLIGKDGGVKLSQSSPLSLDKLFETIDGMFMRQQEMKKRGQ